MLSMVLIIRHKAMHPYPEDRLLQYRVCELIGMPVTSALVSQDLSEY